jgi:hypothetical protein
MQEPPFCPNRYCCAFASPPDGKWWQLNGTYATLIRGDVQRFRCLLCGKGFSEQTFSLDYYAKKTLDYRLFIEGLSCCMGIRQMGRLFGVDRGTIINKVMRLSRNAMDVMAKALDKVCLEEELVADGLASYWVSQYYPNNFNVVLGKRSRFLYFFNAVTLRRSGRMREEQKRRRSELEKRFRPDSKALKTAFTTLCRHVLRLVARSKGAADGVLRQFFTDEHQTYKRVTDTDVLWQEYSRREAVEHLQVSSLAPRNAANPLAAANTYDRSLRNDMAEHVRETIRFARNANHSMERFICYGCFHNFLRPHRVNQKVADKSTHAYWAGIGKETVGRLMRGFYRYRRFLSRSTAIAYYPKLWLRMEPTPLKEGCEYLPKYLCD